MGIKRKNLSGAANEKSLSRHQSPFILHLTPTDLDALGHVNNAVWARRIQDVATAHWRAVARAEDVARQVWVVLRRETD